MNQIKIGVASNIRISRMSCQEDKLSLEQEIINLKKKTMPHISI